MNDGERRAELAHFLRTRRERLKPSQFNLPDGGRRRTPGLRREELAQLAGIGLTWYIKLEQGQDIQVSAQVLESLARTLQLTPDERTYLYVLAREQLPLPTQGSLPQISPELQNVLDAFLPGPAFVINERLDIIGWNRTASRVFADYAALPTWERNLVWLIFTDPAQRKIYVQWEEAAQRILGLFRASGAQHADEDWFIQRRDQLMQASSQFRMWWIRHDVGEERLKRKELVHPVMGLLVVQPMSLVVEDDPNLTVCLYTPLPEEETADKLTRLAQEPEHEP
ncbi:XRE family transcriptional regulator [Ktedonosporobacter rubrisoli]|uniref:XRE family transcriptional regulator n=1 Tax=Ktedonosporobacter rubrisoli TaxID=2509675 RepID=A0A4P6JIT3_KTERU|nr:helix-turn-helix transcriptional regulator [Ktedonosporobacter rubrisoli]QBD74822.1 XRE family transcriptional regulator [Ktedonosporobacter rubrisoli]